MGRDDGYTSAICCKLIRRPVYLKRVGVIVCKLCLNKPDFKKKSKIQLITVCYLTQVTGGQRGAREGEDKFEFIIII